MAYYPSGACLSPPAASSMKLFMGLGLPLSTLELLRDGQSICSRHMSEALLGLLVNARCHNFQY